MNIKLGILKQMHRDVYVNRKSIGKIHLIFPEFQEWEVAVNTTLTRTIATEIDKILYKEKIDKAKKKCYN